MKSLSECKILMLCGGVGGARAALALYESLPSEKLSFIVNTGDDFTHLGLEIWPDWDTVVYHLAGVQEQTRGWGRADEGLRCMEEFRRFGAPDWFHLGDRDLALHLYRSHLLQQGTDKAAVCSKICSAFEIKSRVLPVSLETLGTQLLLEDGRQLDFQDWFVKEQCKGRVQMVQTPRAEKALLCSGVSELFSEADLILLAPSNPYLSLEPMLRIPALQRAYAEAKGVKLAVSPLIGGKAIKGPLDSLIETLSPFVGQEAIIDHWADRVDGLLLPPDEVGDFGRAKTKLFPCPTLLKTEKVRAAFVDGLMKIWETI